MLYNFYLVILVPFLLKPANKIRFGITPDQSVALTAALPDYTSKFNLYVDPNTHSTPIINDVNNPVKAMTISVLM